MEGQETPPPLPPPLLPHLSTNNSPYLFTPSLLPSSSMHPPLVEPQLGLQVPEVDWVSLLSGRFMLGENRPIVEEEKGSKEKRKIRKTRKQTRPRFAFQTRSAEDILEDGYRWRKYGQKAVKNSSHPRSYYRCTYHTCNVKKQVQRLSKDTGIVVTTYEGIHSHPCEKLMETLTPLLKQMQFLARF